MVSTTVVDKLGTNVLTVSVTVIKVTSSVNYDSDETTSTVTV